MEPARADDRHDRFRASRERCPILLSLLTTHTPRGGLIVMHADFKGEAGADSFRDFPQVVAVISNMAEEVVG